MICMYALFVMHHSKTQIIIDATMTTTLHLSQFTFHILFIHFCSWNISLIEKGRFVSFCLSKKLVLNHICIFVIFKCYSVV